MKRFLFEIYLFGVVGYTYAAPEHGIKLGGFSLFAWVFIGLLRIANHKDRW